MSESALEDYWNASNTTLSVFTQFILLLQHVYDSLVEAVRNRVCI